MRRKKNVVVKAEEENKEIKENVKLVLLRLDPGVQKRRNFIQNYVNTKIIQIETLATNYLNKIPKNVGDMKLDDIINMEVDKGRRRQTSIGPLTKALEKQKEALFPEKVVTDESSLNSRFETPVYVKVEVKTEVAAPKKPRPKKGASDTGVLTVGSRKAGIVLKKPNSTIPIVKTVKFKNKAIDKQDNRRLTRALSQQMASRDFHSLYDINKEQRAFSDISTSTGQMPKPTKSSTPLVLARKPNPGERVYLISSTGSPLSNLEARSMPTLLLPLQDGSNIAISRSNEFNSLGHDAKMHLQRARQEFNSLFHHI